MFEQAISVRRRSVVARQLATTVLLVALVIGLMSRSSAASQATTFPPAITGFTPAAAAKGSTVTITGNGFTGATSVKLNGTNAAFTVTSNNLLTFTVPTAITSGVVTVVTPSGTLTSAVTFTVLAGPTIAGFNPTSGPAGTQVTVTGTNLLGTSGVKIGTILTVPTSVSATQVVFTIPSGVASGQITVLTSNGSATSSGTFTVTG